MKEVLLEKKGVTLIALLITVIILLILAGTVISIAISGENIFSKTADTRNKWNSKVMAEEDALFNVLEYIGILRPDEVAPTPPTEIFITGIKGTKATVQANGGTDNNSIVLYKYSLNNGADWTEPISSDKPYIFTGLTRETEYIVIAKSVDGSGNESVPIEIGKSFTTTDEEYEGKIGEYVHYEIGLDIGPSTGENAYSRDWIVFYEDEITGITYLIAADYVPNTNAALTAARTAGGLLAGTGDYATYGVYQDTASQLTKTSITTSVAERNKFSWNGTINQPKHKITATLLDSDVWSSFVLQNVQGINEGDIQAVGGPTAELWMESWKQRGYTELYLATNVADEEIEGSNAQKYGSGYYVGKTANPTNTTVSTMYDLNSFTKTGYRSVSAQESDPSALNKVYFPHNEGEQNCNGYWLASPSARTYNNSMMHIGYDGDVDRRNFSNKNYGLRPVVSMPTSIIGENSSSAIYYTGININD